MDNKIKISDHGLSIVLIRQNLYALGFGEAGAQETAEQIEHIESHSLPAGYAWGDLIFEEGEWYIEVWLKEGQARTGDVIKRVKSLGGVQRQFIFDVIADDCFKKPGFDQEVLQWRDDDLNEESVTRDKTKKSKELMRYHTINAFLEAPHRRREALRKMLNNDEVGRTDLDLRVPTIEMLLKFLKNYRTVLKTYGVYDLYELCARFGKTIYGLSCFALADQEVGILSAYYQSAFASFMNTISKFHQFSNIRIVDARAPAAQDKFNTYRKEGFKVLIICGLQGEDVNWYKKYQWVHELEDTFGIGDEVDFGWWTDKQAKRVIWLYKNSSYTMPMTGTGGKKLFEHYDIRNYEKCTMEEMLTVKQILKEDPTYAPKKFKELMTAIENE